MPALNLPFLSRERERKPCEQGHSRGNEKSQGTRKDTAEQGSGGVARSRVVLRLASLTTRNGELARGLVHITGYASVNKIDYFYT